MLIWIEVIVGFAVPITWAAWELWSLKREKRRDAAKRERVAVQDRHAAVEER